MTFPDRASIEKAFEKLRSEVYETPLVDGSSIISELHIKPATLSLKLELFQKTNSFKIRGALNLVKSLSDAQLKNGIVSFSAGNHAIASAYAAKLAGVTAKAVMPSTSNPSRVASCRDLGAEVILVEKRSDVPAVAQQIEMSEGRTLVPPFEHPKTVEGTATLGLEIIRQNPNLDVFLVPIGGGGLAAGVGCAIKQYSDRCKVIGVQAKSADAMLRSFQSGKPELNVNVDTVADSLCPPQVGHYTFEACKKYLDGVIAVEEADTKAAMRMLFSRFRLIVEGAGSISLGALLGSRNRSLDGKNVGVIVSGSNIDLNSFISNSEL